MATHSSILAWRIPWAEEPGGLQSMWSQRVRQDWSDLARTHVGAQLFLENIFCPFSMDFLSFFPDLVCHSTFVSVPACWSTAYKRQSSPKTLTACLWPDWRTDYSPGAWGSSLLRSGDLCPCRSHSLCTHSLCCTRVLFIKPNFYIFLLPFEFFLVRMLYKLKSWKRQMMSFSYLHFTVRAIPSSNRSWIV